MPAGVSWTTYLKFSFAAGLSMVAGAQTVHFVYRPLEDLDQFIKKFEEENKNTSSPIVKEAVKETKETKESVEEKK